MNVKHLFLLNVCICWSKYPLNKIDLAWSDSIEATICNFFVYSFQNIQSNHLCHLQLKQIMKYNALSHMLTTYNQFNLFSDAPMYVYFIV